jgi:parvulin-like peptidyl-prolyl isomerase
MRAIFTAVLCTWMLFTACSTKDRYPKDSKPYAFLKRLSESVPSMNPDKSTDLIKSTQFTIRSTDVMPIVYRFLNRYEGQLATIPKAQLARFVNQRIAEEGEKVLLYTAAVENGIKIPDDSVDTMMETVYKNMGGKDTFVQNLTSDGWTLDRYRRDVRMNLAINRYLETVLYRGIAITEEDIRKAYREKETATVRHILLVTQNARSDSQKASIRLKLEGILARARKGEDFARLARLYTEDPGTQKNGGLYENFERGAMVQPFDELAFTLPVGKLSDVFETQYGYHILKVISREKEKRPLDEVRAGLERDLLAQQRRQAIENGLKTLKLKYEYKELWGSL